MFPLGPGPLPTTSAELADRLTSGLRTILHLEATAPVQVEAEIGSTAEVTSLRVGTTGVDIRPTRGERPDPVFTAAEGEVIVRRFELSAHPLRLQGVPVTVDAVANGVPATWRRTDSGELWLVPDSENHSGPAPDGTIDLDVVLADAEVAIREIAGRVVARQGFTLKSLDVDVQATSRRSAAVRVDATIGKSILSAKAYATGNIAVDDAMRLTTSDLKLNSGNPLVVAMLGMADRYVQPWNNRTMDLSLLAFAGASVKDVVLTTENGRLHLHAAIG